MKNVNEKSRVFLIALSLLLWGFIVVLAIYVLGFGNHLKPRAAGPDVVAAPTGGLIIGDGGQGVASAEITLSKNGKNNYIFSDRVGVFVIKNIDPGSYEVLIRVAGYKMYKGEIILDGKNDHTFKLSLTN